MKLKSVLFGLLLTTAHAYADPAEGQWVTVDDDDGTHKSVVEITINEEGQLQGTVTRILQEEKRGRLCEECPDEFRGQPVEGLTFMWGLKKEDDGEWDGGRILDPESGNVYKSKLNVADDGQSLTVRGYIGVSWIGRSQTWLRFSAEEEASDSAAAQ
ncbi:MAG: DUF2147 domain-containing protein [Pseudomonadota bacterium]|nr:DUF2147 domain-containing protein [Pseudomonadota bacterium]